MQFRWKLLILLIFIALVPVLLMRTFGVHGLRRLGAELVSQTRENLVVSTQKQLHLVVDSYSQVLWQGREQLELALLVQAKEVERALAHPPEPFSDAYLATDFAAGRNLPADLVPSADHFRGQEKGHPAMMPVATSPTKSGFAEIVPFFPLKSPSSMLQKLILWFKLCKSRSSPFPHRMSLVMVILSSRTIHSMR